MATVKLSTALLAIKPSKRNVDKKRVACIHGPTGNWYANCSVESGAPAISTVQCQSAVSRPRFEHGMRHLLVANRVCAEATTDVCRR